MEFTLLQKVLYIGNEWMIDLIRVLVWQWAIKRWNGQPNARQIILMLAGTCASRGRTWLLFCWTINSIRLSSEFELPYRISEHRTSKKQVWHSEMPECDSAY